MITSSEEGLCDDTHLAGGKRDVPMRRRVEVVIWPTEQGREPLTKLGRLTITPKSGREALHSDGAELGVDLLSFWRWSTSDLVSNLTRGKLAEFIVAVALDVPVDGVRNEWDAYDLEMRDGARIEVKSAAYLQGWHQKQLSTIKFQVPKTMGWNPDTNRQEDEPRRHADVYVFALLAHRDKPTVDPLNVNQWRFYVLPTRVLDERTRSQHSITLKTLDRLSGGPVLFDGLKARVEEILGREG